MECHLQPAHRDLGIGVHAGATKSPRCLGPSCRLIVHILQRGLMAHSREHPGENHQREAEVVEEHQRSEERRQRLLVHLMPDQLQAAQTAMRGSRHASDDACGAAAEGTHLRKS